MYFVCKCVCCDNMYVYVAYLEKNRDPDNWLPSLRGQKRGKRGKKDVKIKRKICLNGMSNFIVAVVIKKKTLLVQEISVTCAQGSESTDTAACLNSPNRDSFSSSSKTGPPFRWCRLCLKGYYGVSVLF